MFIFSLFDVAPVEKAHGTIENVLGCFLSRLRPIEGFPAEVARNLDQ